MTEAFTDLLQSAEVKRSNPGEYIKGLWVSGGETIVPIQVVAQPASEKETNDLRQSGDATVSYKKFYTEAKIITANKATKVEADVIVFNGESYKAIIVSDWTDIGKFRKVLAIKLDES